MGGFSPKYVWQVTAYQGGVGAPPLPKPAIYPPLQNYNSTVGADPRVCPDGRLSAKNMCPSISGQGWDHPRTSDELPHTKAGTGPRPYQNRQNFPGEFTLQSMIPQWKGCEKAGVPKNPRSVLRMVLVIPYCSLKKRCRYFLRRVKIPQTGR